MEITNVWSPFYVNEMIQRVRYSVEFDGEWGSHEVVRESTDISYVQQDANYNVTSLTDETGAVVERYGFDPYGQQTWMDADWGALSNSAIAFEWESNEGRGERQELRRSGNAAINSLGSSLDSPLCQSL